MQRYGLMVLFLVSCWSHAHTFTMGKPVPAVSVADKGEMQLRNGQIHYQTWNSQSLTGKARLLIHVAGRLSAKEQSAGLISAIQQASLPEKTFQTTTIVNTDDALPGSSIFVVNSIRSSKKASPWQQFIIDSSGLARHRWQLKPGGAAAIVLDAQGNVQFAKDTPLSADDISQIISLLRALTR
ncbi:YtfJ family protein [Pantoea stewartii]|uniref:YtfJ family protein n=2 Tax=Erwiniaceae TaxID=1903409 RepID=UPI00345F0EDB